MKKGLLALLICFLLTGMAFAAGKKTTISVMDINATSGLSTKELALLTDKLLNSLVEYRVYEVVERSKRDEILKEQGFQMTGACSEASCLVEIGQLLGAQKMIGGTIGKLGNVYAVELRMIDIQTGKIDLAFSQKYSGNISMLLDAMTEAAARFSKWRPAATGTSGVMVVSQPDQAKIIVDGTDWGLTPRLVHPLESGPHQVLVLKDGYAVFSTQVQINAGIVDSLFAKLERNVGRIEVVSRPAGARVFLDGTYKGKTAASGLLLDNLEVMQYKLTVRKKGYRRYEQNLLSRSGEVTGVKPALALRRWVIRPLEFGSGSYGRVAYNDKDFHKKKPPFYLMAGLGYRINRYFMAGLGFQVGLLNVSTPGIKIQDATYGDIEMQDWSSTEVFPVMLSLRVSLPVWVAAIEPYAEIGFGGGAVSSTEEVNFYSNTGDPLAWIKFHCTSSGYKRLQAGGGMKWWMSDVTGLTLSFRYNSDVIEDLSTYFNPALTTGDVVNQTINATTSVDTGTLSVGSTAFGLGLEIAF